MSTNGRCHFDAAANAYVVQGQRVPRVSHILELAGYTLGSGAPQHLRTAAMEKGTLIDAGVDLDWDDLEPVLRGPLRAWQAFREREPFQIDATEEAVGTLLHGGFGGTLDRRGTWAGRPCILDIKSGKKIYWPTRYQLALYLLAHLVPPERTDALGVPKQFAEYERRVVWLRDDGTYQCPPPYTDAADLADALAAVRVAHTRLRNGAKVGG